MTFLKKKPFLCKIPDIVDTDVITVSETTSGVSHRTFLYVGLLRN